MVVTWFTHSAFIISYLVFLRRKFLIVWTLTTWQTKIVKSSLPLCWWPPNVAWWWLIMRGFHPKRSHDSLNTRLHRVVTYWEALTRKSRNLLIMWSCKVTYQIKSLYFQCLYYQCLWLLIFFLFELICSRLNQSISISFWQVGR